MGPVNFALRAFSLAFLAWHGALLFPGLAEPAVLAAVAVVGLAGGAWARPLRGWLAGVVGAAVFVTVQNLAVWVPIVLAGSGPSVLDTIPLWVDRQATFALLPFALGWVEGWAFTGRPDRRGLERVIHAVVAVLVFWSQGPYHVTLYPHPLALALADGSFLASELILLAGKPARTASWAAVVLVAAAGLAVLWTLLGRYEDQATAAGGGLMKPDLFQFDFAPLVRLEEEITLGENLVLLYREEGPPKARYLRRLVLESWDPSRGFSLAGGQGPVVGRKARTLEPGAVSERVPVRQEYYLVNIDPSSLLTLNEPTAVTPYARWDGSSFVNAYRVDSLVAGEDFWLYNEQRDDGLTPAQRALATKGGDDPEIRALAEQVTRDADTPYEKATAIVLYLKENYFYSLKPGAPGARGALKHFLFEGKKGYCSYFAFSMTLMLRSLGIPARVAVGFATDPTTAVLGFTPVRAYQAHAWVEVPFGPYGWLEFDPTSETPAPGEPFRFPKASDPDQLSKMISEILDAQPVPLTEQPGEAARPDPAAVWARVWTAGAPLLPWLILAAALGANEAWRHRWTWRRWRARDDRGRVLVWWAETVARSRRARRGPLPGETPTAWAARTGDRALADLARRTEEARYAARIIPETLIEAKALARTLGRQFDRSRPPLHRIAGNVLPWWPR